MSATGLQKYRAFIVAGSVAALTIVGTLTGATLKSDKEQRPRQSLQVTTAEKLSQMEHARSELVRKSTELETKIAAIEERMRAKVAGSSSNS